VVSAVPLAGLAGVVQQLLVSSDEPRTAHLSRLVPGWCSRRSAPETLQGVREGDNKTVGTDNGKPGWARSGTLNGVF